MIKQDMAMDALGTHLHLEIWQASASLLDDVDALRTALRAAADKARCTVVGELFHRYAPQGVTGVLLLAESHLSIHTWPELGYAAVDVFTCGDKAMPERAADFVVEQLAPCRFTVATFARGVPAPVRAHAPAGVPASRQLTKAASSRA